MTNCQIPLQFIHCLSSIPAFSCVPTSHFLFLSPYQQCVLVLPFQCSSPPPSIIVDSSIFDFNSFSLCHFPPLTITNMRSRQPFYENHQSTMFVFHHHTPIASCTVLQFISLLGGTLLKSGEIFRSRIYEFGSNSSSILFLI